MAHIAQQYRASQQLLSSHDTLSLVGRDGQGRVAAGVSTSGLAFKSPGRIGDSPLCGAVHLCQPAVTHSRQRLLRG